MKNEIVQNRESSVRIPFVDGRFHIPYLNMNILGEGVGGADLLRGLQNNA